MRMIKRVVWLRSECPLLAQSGHHNCTDECPLSGVKRTLLGHRRMSTSDPKRTLQRAATEQHRRGYLRHSTASGLPVTFTPTYPEILKSAQNRGIGPMRNKLGVG